MATGLNVYVGLDLGSDTLKISYALNDGGLKTGKIAGSEMSATAVPALAYYDFDENKWLFGEDVETVGDKTFIGVVKIKFLLSLLLKKVDASVTDKNSEYYFKGNEFPKFYFPVKKKLPDDFSQAVGSNMTFSVKGVTPADVCLAFFRYVESLVKRRSKALAKKYGKSGLNIIPSVVYPQYSSKAYIAELERLVSMSFENPPSVVLSMTKALCAYAMQTNRIKTGESVLIFNMGEERISVVKASLLKTGLSVDGADGHNAPRTLGGNDIDDAVANFLETGMSARESMGRPSVDQDGYLAEGSINSKQYLFVKDIKGAKAIFGMPVYDKGVFKNGVPVCVSRDLYIQRYLTREQFSSCVGVTDGSGFAGKVLGYINEELDRPVNSEIKKIFLTGGPVETYGLVEFIEKKLKSRVKVQTFENSDESYANVENDGFNILSHEDALYAPALGCAISDLKKIDIKTVLALTYGLRLFLYDGETPYFEMLVNKGDILPPDGKKFFTPRPEERTGLTTSTDSVMSAPMNILSLVLSREDIAAGKNSGNLKYVVTNTGKRYLECNPMDAKSRARLEKYAGMKLLNGNADKKNAGAIYYYYDNTRVRLVNKVYAIIGVDVDGEGRARPFAENDVQRNGSELVTIYYLWDVKKNGKLVHKAGDRDTVYKRDIRFDFDIDEMTFS